MFQIPCLSAMESNFPQKQRFRANSIVEKAKVKSMMPLRLLQCVIAFGLLFFGYQIYNGWKQCDPTSNTFICSRIYRNSPFHKVNLSLNASYKSSSNVETHPIEEDSSLDRYILDINDFKLPIDITINAKSPLWQSKSYFHESPESLGHRAAGYGGNETEDLQDFPYIRASLLRHLFNSFNAFSIENDFIFWLAHGTLLGQYWGEKIMAEDTDVDVQTSIAALHRLQSHAGKLFRDRFQLQINPHYVIRKSANNYFTEKAEANVIDARWVDTLSGHFIDITALATSEAVAGQDRLIQKETLSTITLQDKSVHYINYTSISPLRRCKFEDILVWCPSNRDLILSDEYPRYKSPHHLSWRYDYNRKIFERMTCNRLIKMYSTPDPNDCDDECKQVTSHDRYLGWMYLVMLGEHHNQCQLEVIWTQGNDRFSRKYRGIHTGEDPAEKMTSNTFKAIDWEQR